MTDDTHAGAHPAGAPAPRPAPPTTEDLLNSLLAECVGLARDIAPDVPKTLIDRGDGRTIHMCLFGDVVHLGTHIGETVAKVRGGTEDVRRMVFDYRRQELPPPPGPNGATAKNE